MLVVHGWWDGGLVLWAEDSVAVGTGPVRVGRRRAVPTHPFAAEADRLAALLAQPGHLVDVVVELPSHDGLPLPSPDLPGYALPADSPPEGAGPDGPPEQPSTQEATALPPTPARWRVPAVRLAAAQALPALLEGLVDPAAGSAVMGTELRSLQQVAGTADDLAARGRVLPTAVVEPVIPAPAGARPAEPGRSGHGGRAAVVSGPDRSEETVRVAAVWRPVLSGADAARARAFLHALPAAVQSPGTTCRDVLIACLDALTDAAVRARLQRAAGKPGRRKGQTPSGRGTGSTTAGRRPAGKGGRSGVPFADWRESLRATDPGFATAADQFAVLQEELNRWQQDVTGGPVRARFRLVEPVAGADADAGAGSTVDARPSPWVVEFGLQAADEPSLVVDAERVWRSRGTLKALARHVPAPQETLLAELGRALRLYPGLEPALRTARPTRLELDAAGAHAFLKEAAPALSAAGFGVLLPGWWGRPAARLGLRASASTPAQPGGVAGAAGLGQAALVDFRWEVALGDETLTEAELVALVELQQPLVRVRGQWVQLDAQRLRNGLKLVLENGSARLSVAELLRVVGSRETGPEGLPVVKVEADGWLGELLNGSGSARFESVAVPDTFVGTLRPYQERGLAWLTFLQRVGVGAVLADDMGLGKTVQLLALMATDTAVTDTAAIDTASADTASTDTASTDTASAEVGPTLLVCPMSVVGNWQREAARFTPHLRVHVHHGAERPRGKEFRAAVASSDLVLTTYALAARDAVALAAVPWRRVVLDEAQAVKNAATKAATAVRSLPARHRIAVTGTPVENRLADLWSLMEFANPGLLGGASQFRQRFAIPVERHGDDDAAARLRAVTQPFILRRVKTDRAIIADLPEKLEMEVVCGLTREQASLYQAVVEDMLRQVAESEGIQRRGLVLSTMTKLKQVCNHPAQLLRDGSRLAGRSGKLARLEETLEEVLSAGEKALLFTQFAEFGAMLRAHLSTRFGQDVIFLHGGVAKADRDAMVARFQSGAPGAPSLFVLSLKAGGTGLTLTAANHVVHVDRWWNPAVEDQATDRAFRIGQTRNVQVRKLVCGGTLEERIATMIRDKRGLAASIVGTGEGWLTELSTDELRELIRLDGGAVVE